MKSNRTFIIIVVVVALLIVGGLVGYYFYTNPKATVGGGTHGFNIHTHVGDVQPAPHGIPVSFTPG